MKRRDFINKCNQCAAVSLLGVAFGNNELYSQNNSTDNNSLVQNIHQKQVSNFLKFIEADCPKGTVEKLYARLGYECFHSRELDKWVESFHGNVDEFFDRVNRGESKYWEKLEFKRAKNLIKLTGRKYSSCACSFAQCENPPISLCDICCKSFQLELFETLLEKKVTIRIDESILHGNDRCCTTIYVDKI